MLLTPKQIKQALAYEDHPDDGRAGWSWWLFHNYTKPNTGRDNFSDIINNRPNDYRTRSANSHEAIAQEWFSYLQTTSMFKPIKLHSTRRQHV